MRVDDRGFARKGDELDPTNWEAFKVGFLPGVVVSADYLREGAYIPRGWGIAWREDYIAASVVMPLPWNLVARAVIRVRRWMKVPPPAFYGPVLVRLQKWHWEQGYRAGKRDGEAMALVTGVVWHRVVPPTDTDMDMGNMEGDAQ